jgi:hypothetical protein
VCPQPRPATTHASGGLRKAGGGSLLNVAPYFQFRCQRLYIAGRRCVTALQNYTAKKRIHLLVSSAKKRYTALMYVRRIYVRRPCTVAHGLSVRKGKNIAEKRYTAPMSMYGGVKEKNRT